MSLRGSSTSGRRRGEGVRSDLRLLRAKDVDAAFEVCAVFNHDTRSFNVANDARAFHDGDPVGRIYISLNRASDHQFFRLNVRLDLAVGTNRQTIADFKSAFDLAVQVEFFIAVDFPPDSHSLTDCGGNLG